jgi:hypothetical protein
MPACRRGSGNPKGGAPRNREQELASRHCEACEPGTPTVTEERAAELGWGRVAVTLTTHAAGGLTDNDFILAAKLDRL